MNPEMQQLRDMIQALEGVCSRGLNENLQLRTQLLAAERAATTAQAEVAALQSRLAAVEKKAEASAHVNGSANPAQPEVSAA